MTLLAILVIVSGIWMTATALHLDDLGTESHRRSSLPAARREPR